MALFGLACPMCVLIIIGLLLYIKANNITNKRMSENFTGAERYYPSRCTNLDFNTCLQTSHCGWLVDGKYNSRCLQGTPVGPINLRLQPDAESSRRRNVQYDRWIYSHQNPFIFC